MTSIILIVLIVVIYAAWVWLLFLWRRPIVLSPADPPEFLGTEVLEQVTVHTVNGDTIRGVLRENMPAGIVLDAAEYLDSEQPVPLAGRVYVAASKINFIQGAS